MELDLHPLACLYGVHKGNYVTLSCEGGMIFVLREGFKGYCLVFLPIILPSYSFVCLVYLCLLNWTNFYSECVAHHSHSNHNVCVSECAISLFIMIILLFQGYVFLIGLYISQKLRSYKLIGCLFHQQRSFLSQVLSSVHSKTSNLCFPTGNLIVKVEWTLFTAFVCGYKCCAQTISQCIHAVVCAGHRWYQLPNISTSGGLAVLLSQVTADSLQ